MERASSEKPPSADPGIILLDDTDYDSDLADLPLNRPRNLGLARRGRGLMTGMLQIPDTTPTTTLYRETREVLAEEDVPTLTTSQLISVFSFSARAYFRSAYSFFRCSTASAVSFSFAHSIAPTVFACCCFAA